MSVLIKGMKMPNCYNCTLESICSRWAKHDVEWQKQNRDEDCPLIEIPPHGRLVDADALLESDLGGEPFKSVIRRVLMQAPTVIEGERRN